VFDAAARAIAALLLASIRREPRADHIIPTA
jgi:hypothetical protein